MRESLPEAYKKGFCNFYGRDFKVNSDVLIPRPETETIIDEIKILAGRPYLPGMKTPERKLPPKFMILDVGTGSSCIATTLKLELPEAEVIGLDISSKALNVARENAKRFGAKVDFMNSDLLSNYYGKKPDVIVANLPYVDKDWEWLDKDALSYEPSVALYAERYGLELIFRLIDEIVKRWADGDEADKRKAGWLVLEADPCQHERIIEYAATHGIEHKKTSGFTLVFVS